MSDNDGQGGRPGERRAIRDVTAELAALRRRINDTDDITRESAGLLAETLPRVGDLEADVATLRGTVDALVADAEDTPAEDPAVTARKAELGLRPEPPGPWVWPLFDAEQAAAAWDSLSKWVGEVLIPTYEVTRGALPDCWPRHRRIVAELSWLRNAYLEAHLRKAPATKAADWHLRHLPGVLAVIAGVVRPDEGQKPVCGPGLHLQRPRPGDYVDPDEGEQLATCEHWSAAWHEVRDADLVGRRPVPDRRQKGGSSS